MLPLYCLLRLLLGLPRLPQGLLLLSHLPLILLPILRLYPVFLLLELPRLRRPVPPLVLAALLVALQAASAAAPYAIKLLDRMELAALHARRGGGAVKQAGAGAG